MNTTDDLRAALRYPSAPTTPDTAEMIAKARRQRANRRALAGSGVVAVAVAATLVVVNALAPAGGPGSGPPIAGESPSLGSDPETPPLVGGAPNTVLVAAAAPLAPEAPARFDPLRRTLHVGWIPTGLSGQQAEITPWQQSFAAKDDDYVNGGPDIGLVVTVLAKGRPVTDLPSGALGLPREAVAQPTKSVNGGEAQCLTDPYVAGSCSAILWRYAPDGWARVSYAGSAGPTPEQAAAVARRVAESVTVTMRGDRVRLPFGFVGGLAGMTAASSLVNVQHAGTTGIHGESWTARVELIPHGTAVQPGNGPQGLLVEAMFKPGDPTGRIERDGAPNTTVHGHPAWLRGDGQALIVWGESNTRATVSFTDGGGDALAAYDQVRLLADPSDPASWKGVG